MINKHKSNKIKENSNTVRHLNNGTDHRRSKSCCDQSSPARRTINKLSFCSPKTSSIPTYLALRTGSPGLYKKGWVMEKGVWVNVSHCSVFCKHGHVISWPSLSFISWPSLSFRNPDSLSTKSSMFEWPQTTDECVWYHSDKIKPQQPLSFWYW